jgi:hypothetical protein
MTSFTPVPRASLRSPKGLDHGEATFTRINFYFVYKTRDFEKLENILPVPSSNSKFAGVQNCHVGSVCGQRPLSATSRARSCQWIATFITSSDA